MKQIDQAEVWNRYERGKKFKNQINLYDTVRTNENFFIGKQWEGVESNGLPTPVFNFLKRVTLFTVASVTSDNLKLNATPLAAAPNAGGLVQPAQVVSDEFEALFERNNVAALIREFMRNAAVDGDGCMFTYWDADAESGHPVKGAVKTEIIENTRVHFGNPNDREVQTQPWIIIESREMVEEARDRARENGCADWESISPDSGGDYSEGATRTDDKVTLLLMLWRDKKTGYIKACEATQNSMVRKEWDLGIKLYPICWLNWDYVQDCYHGQAMITGLIPNQIFVNKIYAMSMISFMSSAFPKVVYDKTRVKSWDNRVNAAIGVSGSVDNVAKIMEPAQISPQIAQFIETTVSMTESNLGATSVALGDTRPDNTSAIIALQRAASVPSELTKQNLYKCIEDLGRIYIDFMGAYYGERMVDIPTPPEMEEVYIFMGQDIPASIPQQFDFGTLQDIPMMLKLDVGASAYWSEIASMQTLDNLLTQNKITLAQYLERVPDGYISKRRELIEEIKRTERNLQGMQEEPGSAGEQLVDTGQKPVIPAGGRGGYSDLQRKVNESGSTEGLI